MSEHIEEQHVESETEAENAAQPMGGHPLFPRPDTETGPDTRRIDLIHIERYTENGREACPTPFLASELRSWNDVISRFGGGTYMARAMCGKTFRFQGNTEKMTFHSPPSRPFTDSPMPAKVAREEEPARPAPAPPPAPAPAPAMPTVLPFFTPAPAPASPPAANNNQLDVGAVILAMLNRPPPPPMDLAPLIGPLVAAATRPAPPPPPPPPPPQGPDMMPLMAAFLQSNAEMMRAMLQAQSKPAPAAPDMLTILRELKPVLSNAGGDNASLLLQGVEIAKGLFQASATSAAPAAAVQPDDLGQILGALTKVMASSSSSSPTPPPAEAAAPRAPMPSTTWAWARTPEGAVVPVALQGGAPAAFAAPQSVLASPPPPPIDLDRKISEVLEGPVMRERLQGAVVGALRTLLTPPARASVPQPARPAPHLRIVPAPAVAQAPVAVEPTATRNAQPPQEVLVDVNADADSSAVEIAVGEATAAVEAEALLVATEPPREVAIASSPLAAYSSERFPLEQPEVLGERVNEAMSVLDRAMREEGPEAAFASAQGLLESPDFVAALVTVAPEMAEHLAQLGGEQARGLFDQVKRDLLATTTPGTEPVTVG